MNGFVAPTIENETIKGDPDVIVFALMNTSFISTLSPPWTSVVWLSHNNLFWNIGSIMNEFVRSVVC